VEDSSLLQAGLRELREEVDIRVQESEVVGSNPLCLWESVYPTSLEKGDPQRQHCVVYYHIQVDKNHNDLKVKMQAEEVDAFTWLDLPLVNLALGGTFKDPSPLQDDDGSSYKDPACQNSLPPNKKFTICVLKDASDGTYQNVEKCCSVLSARYEPWTSCIQATSSNGRCQTTKEDAAPPERLSSGTLYALQQWATLKSALIKKKSNLASMGNT